MYSPVGNSSKNSSFITENLLLNLYLSRRSISLKQLLNMILVKHALSFSLSSKITERLCNE